MECFACVSEGRDALVPFQTEELLRCHIALDHVFWAPFECILCPLTLLPTETVLKRHYEQFHPKNVPRATYTYVEEKKLEIQRILDSSKICESVIESNRIQVRIETHSAALQNPKDKRFAVKLEQTTKERTSTSLFSPHKSRNSSIASPDEYDGAIEMVLESKEEEIENDSERMEKLDGNTKERPILSFNSSDKQIEGRNSSNLKDGCDVSRGSITNESPRTPLKSSHVQSETNSKYSATTTFAYDNEMELEGHEEEETDKSNVVVSAGSRPETTNKHPANTCHLCGIMLKVDNLKARKYHLWRQHMPAAPIECLHCDWKVYTPRNVNKEGRAHIKAKHPELAELAVTELFADNRQHLNQILAINLQQAFPLAQSNARHQCRICQSRVSVNHCGEHIWIHHLEQKRFQCQLCSFSTSILFTMINKHVRRVHTEQKQGVVWTDNSKKLQSDFQRVFRVAFGKGGNHKSD